MELSVHTVEVFELCSADVCVIRKSIQKERIMLALIDVQWGGNGFI